MIWTSDPEPRARRYIHASARDPASLPGRPPGSRSPFGEFLLEALGFVMTHQAIHEGSKLAIHHFGELMDCQTDAVVGDAVLRIIIGPNFFRAVTGFDLTAAFGGDGGLLLFEFHFVKAGTQHAQGLGTVFDL